MNPSFGYMKVVKILTAVLSITLLILIIYTFLARRLIKEDWLRGYLVSYVESAIGKEIGIKEMKISLFPTPSVRLEGVEIYEKEGRLFFSSPRIKGEVGVLSLLFFRPIIKSLSVEEPILYLRKGRKIKAWSFPFAIARLKVRDGRVLFEDTTVEPAVSAEIREMNLTMETGLFGGYSFRIRGLLGRDDRFGKVEVEGKVTGRGVVSMEGRFYTIDVTLLRPCLGEGPQPTYGYMDGRFSFKGGLEGGTFKGRLSSPRLHIVFKPYYMEPLKPSGIQLSFTGDATKERLSLRNLRILFDGAEFYGEFAVDLTQGIAEGTFRSSWLDMPWLYTYLPSTESSRYLREHIGEGLLEIEEMGFKGRVEDLFSTEALLKDVKARVALKEVVATLGEGYPKVKHLSGVVTYTHGEISLAGIKGMYGESILKDVSGGIKGVFSERPEVNMAFKGDLKLGDAPTILSFIPGGKGLLRSIDGLKGDAGVEGYIKGGMGRMDFQAEAILKGIGFTYRPFSLEVSDVKGRIAFTPEEIILKKIGGGIRGSGFFIEEGRISNYTSRRPRLYLRGSSTLDLRDLKALKPFSPALKSWLSRIDIYGGTASIDGEVRRDRIFSFKGMGRIRDGELFLLPYRVKVSDVRGGFEITEKDLKIEGINASVGLGSFSIKGSIKGYLSERSLFNLEGTHTIRGEDLIRFLPEGMEARGTSRGVFSIKGRRDALTIKGNTMLKGIAFGIPGRLYKSADIGGGIEYSFLYRNGGLSSFRFGVGMMGITLRGVIKDPKRLDIDGVISVKGLKTEDLKGIIPAVIVSPGRIDGKVRIKGPVLKRDKLRLTGMVTVKALAFRPTQGPPFRDVTFTMKLKGRDIEVPSLHISRGESYIDGSMRVKGLIRPEVSLNIHSKRWRKEDFPPNELVKRLITAFLKGGKVDGNLVVMDGSYNGIGFKALKSTLSMRDGVWSLSPFRVNLQDGLMVGTLRMAPGKDEGNLYTLDMEWADGDIEKVIREWLGKERIMTGRFDARALVQWKGRSKYEHLRSLTGKVTVELRDGRMYYLFTVLSKLVGLLNPIRIITLDLPSFSKKGMAYRKARGNFRLESGVLTTEDVVIEGREMQILWIGSVDIPEKRIDSYMAVQPFKVVDKVLEKTLGKIPLIGTILLGRDKKLLVLYYRVEGDLSDPAMKGMNVKEMGKGIMERFKILLPGLE